MIKFNGHRLIPNRKDVIEIFLISLASLFSYFILTTPFYKVFPMVETYPLYVKIIIFVGVI